MPVGAVSFRAGAGIYRQQPDLGQTVGSFGSPDARPERSRHLEAGIEHAWRPGVRWQVTFYNRQERDVLQLERRDGDLYIGGERNAERLPAYSRLDIRANRAFNFETRRLTLFVEIVNLSGRTNHAPDEPRVYRSGQVLGATQRLFPFLPTAGLQIDF